MACKTQKALIDSANAFEFTLTGLRLYFGPSFLYAGFLPLISGRTIAALRSKPMERSYGGADFCHCASCARAIRAKGANRDQPLRRPSARRIVSRFSPNSSPTTLTRTLDATYSHPPGHRLAANCLIAACARDRGLSLIVAGCGVVVVACCAGGEPKRVGQIFARSGFQAYPTKP